jgi:putative dehydrogenase
MSIPLRIAVLGQAKAATTIASGLAAAGADVIGFDAKPPRKPQVTQAESLEAAVQSADIVLSINSSTQAFSLAQKAAQYLKPDALFADLNTGTPALKLHLATLFPEGNFVDVAVMKPVAELGIAVPLIAAGPSAPHFGDLLAPLNLNLEVVSEQVGDAAARELVRSILAKNIAGVVVDYMWAAEKLGLSDWAYGELQREFESMTAETAKNYLINTVANAKHLELEMTDVAEMLEKVDYPSMFVPQTQLVYNKIYHSIKVPFSDQPDEDD